MPSTAVTKNTLALMLVVPQGSLASVNAVYVINHRELLCEFPQLHRLEVNW
jgi:hypothetical protein